MTSLEQFFFWTVIHEHTKLAFTIQIHNLTEVILTMQAL